MSGPQAEWKGRAEFAEIAEVLVTNTEWIFAAKPEAGGRWFVLYTPHYGQGDNTMWSAWLKRDSDGVLQLDRVPKAHPGMYERLEAEIEKGLEGGDDAA